jgi:anaerobic ribonucleoside-triphosphate reductase
MAVATEINAVAANIRAMGIIDAPVGTTVQGAISGRGPTGTINFNFSSDRLILCYPQLKVYDTQTNLTYLEPYSPRLAGVIAAKDIERGYHWSPSNTEIKGIIGVERNLTSMINDPASEVNLLNEAGILTVFNSFGSGSSKIGSLGVVTINLPRLAFKHQNDNNLDCFYKELKELVIVCARINNAKRKLVQKRIDNGNHPLYELGFIDIQTQYSTVGINGFNECIEILGKDILTNEGQKLGLSIIETINTENDRCSAQYKTAHNCEQIPAENVSIKLAQKDELLKYNNKYKIYSNQFIPLVTKADMLDRIKLQGLFDKHFSGGAIAHINVETPIQDEQQIVDLIKTCAKMGVVYWAINYNLQECEKGHMSVGRGSQCIICGSDIINNYTRVVGFLTSTKNWHEVRREIDYPNRQFYNGEKI